MSRLELESATDLIDLDPLGPPQEGWFASAGATGFGFPGRKTQWSEGAANGATFRNARELARVFDLPIHGKGANRSAMQTLLSRMAVALADPCTLRFTDAGAAVWELTVVRTGGGDYAYGSDDHQPADDELNIVVTLQTDGNPFWRRVTGQTQALAKPFGNIVFVNAGDAPAKPVWTVTGPGINLRFVSPVGEVSEWNGLVGLGESLTIDTAARTAIDNLGRNRYGEFGAAPRFFALAAGTSTVAVAFDSTSADFTAAFGTNTYNFVTNPRFPNLTGWTGSDTILWNPGSAQSTSDSVSANTLRAAVTGGGIQRNRSIAITGLTVGKLYRFGATIQWLKGSTAFGKATQPHIPPAISVGFNAAGLARTEIGAAAARIVTGTFVASATTATLVLASGSHKNYNSNSTSIFSEPFVTEGDNGSYFDGATVLAGATYSWEAGANVSRSIRAVAGAPSNATTAISVAWNPRRQAVI